MGSKQFDVFLSYSSLDGDWVLNLKNDLLKYELSVWLDKDEIRPGDMFIEVLEKAIEQSGAIVFVISKNSMRSGWVKEEYSRALNLRNSKGLKVQLIPVILHKAPLPPFLSSRHWVDFSDPDKYSENILQLVWGITGKKPIDKIELSAPAIVKDSLDVSGDSPRQFSVKVADLRPEHLLNEVRRIIASHGLDDDEWAQAISAQYFLVGIGKLLELTEQEDYKNLLNKFLRSFYHRIDGTVVLEDSHILVTPEELKHIVECMLAEDKSDNYYSRTARMRAENIDANLLHYNYLYGLTVQISGAARNFKILQEVHQLALDKLIHGSDKSPLDVYGGWYPYRVPWITARVLISLKYADYKSRSDSQIIENAIEKSLHSLVQRIYMNSYWRSGVGSWVTEWESTALCLEALETWDFIPNCKDEVKRVLKYTMQNREKWLTEPDFSSGEKSNQTLSTVCLLSVLSTIMLKYFSYDDFDFSYDKMISYFERCINVIDATPEPNNRQYCTIPSIAFYIIRVLC